MQNNQKVLMLGGGTSNSMLLRLMASSTLVPVDDALSEFAVNDVEAALALSFTTNEYRTGNSETTFADAFTGTSPKLTYSTAAGSNSTMVNSSGEIVWAPHNLIRHSEDLSGSTWLKANVVDPPQQSTTVLAPDGSGYAYYIEEDSTSNLHYIADKFGPLLNTTWTASVYIKQKNAGVYVQLRPFGVGQGLAFATFSPADGTLYQSGGTELVSAVDGVAAGDGWFKVSMTCSTSLLDAFDGLEITMTDGSTGERPSYLGSGNGVYIWGAHVYRSDLGGMAQVPGAATGLETYVPTNGNPEYLPRVGHHVYNGSTWVNEGLLIESEPRTNLVTHSEDFSHASWGKTLGMTPTYDATVSPSGQNDADLFVPDTNSQVRSVYVTGFTSDTYTFSVFAKSNGGTNDQISIWLAETSQRAVFDLGNGTVNNINLTDASIEAVGNGWYRCVGYSSTATTQARIYLQNGNSFTGNDSDGIYLWGAQLEAGPTPSSYMPTSGGTFTRTAQSLTVPPAEFGWPEPEYIGPELVDNSEFTSDLNLWTEKGTSGVVTWDASGAALIGDGDGATNTKFTQIVDTVVGAVYELSVDVSGTGTGVLIGVDSNYGSSSYNDSGTVVYRWVANSVSEEVTIFRFRNHVGQTLIDNVKVREINPLSVSIQMDGRMTYADRGRGVAVDGQTGEVMFTSWRVNNSNYIAVGLSTGGSATGQPVFLQEVSGSYDFLNPAGSPYTPGINVPFNLASRHGSTFINAAVDGVALDGTGWEYGDTTPTALPDLSSTDLEIAPDFMGTIGTFRQFAGDIGDDGLEEATS